MPEVTRHLGECCVCGAPGPAVCSDRCSRARDELLAVLQPLPARGWTSRDAWLSDPDGGAWLAATLAPPRPQVVTADGRPLHGLEPWWLGVLLADPCAYCGRRGGLELDHIDPRRAGGQDGWENITPACRSCNASKTFTPLLRWLASRA